MALILILLAICSESFLYAHSTYAQQIVLTVNIKNGSLGDVFSSIEKNS
jgi:hypothetical protein